MKTEKFVINVGRQLGSGGKEIGLRLARDFGISCYDKELLGCASEASGLSRDRFEKSDEHKGWLKHAFGGIAALSASGSYYLNPISEESLFHLQGETIRRLAEKQSCVFIGRCADYVLRDMTRCVNVFIAADEADRVARLCRLHGVSEEKARQMMEQGDAKRAKYYNFYSNRRWGEAATYHLCVNSSVLGLDGTTEYIEWFAKRKLGME